MRYLNQFLEKMKQENLHPIVQQSFTHYYQKIVQGETGMLSELEISAPKPANIVTYQNLTSSDSSVFDKLAVIKLNGGLGTSMGLKKAKSLLKVKEDLNFLDIISNQILHARKTSGKRLPLLFMNSFNTRNDTLEFLKKYPELKLPDLPLDFVQNKFPKVRQDNLAPLGCEADHQNWNPPGHGEIYLTLGITGVLEDLLQQGFEYAFISNADNLGAVPDEKIASYFASENLPFLMEVCKRTEMDKKGGHLAETKDGNLVLREVAQCPESEIDFFQDIKRYQYFNTNNLWINLFALKKALESTNHTLPLPLIRNKKEVEGISVYQIETAMGAAINVFPNSKAIVIPRSRFLPVKKTNDLLVLWSDAFQLQPDFSLKLQAERTPVVSLNENYQSIGLLQSHFMSVPSLKNCQKFNVSGDVYFGENVSCTGEVNIIATSKANISNRTLVQETLRI